MTQQKRYTFEQLRAAIASGMSEKEIELSAELDEARAIIYEAYSAMTPTAACQSVIYADMMRYLDGITDDYLKEAEQI